MRLLCVFLAFLLLGFDVLAVPYPDKTYMSNRPEYINTSMTLVDTTLELPAIVCLHHYFKYRSELIITITSDTPGIYDKAFVIKTGSGTFPGYEALKEIIKAHTESFFVIGHLPYLESHSVYGLMSCYLYIDRENGRRVNVKLDVISSEHDTDSPSLFPYSKPKGLFKSSVLHQHVIYGQERTMRVGGPPFSVSSDGEPNMGNYGLYYRVFLWIHNPTSTVQKLHCYVQPRGGNSSTLTDIFEILLGHSSMQPWLFYYMTSFTVYPGTTQYNFRIYQVNGANYPIDYVFTHKRY